MLSIVVPVYRNEDSLPELLDQLATALGDIRRDLGEDCEVIFVVDGSPDRCELVLRERLPAMPFRSKLITHSRNFGAFAAVRTGLAAGDGEYLAMMAADLQEPPDLMGCLLETLRAGDADVVVGEREPGRGDPWSTRLASWIFWTAYRRLVVPDLPPGGVDVFGCTRRVRDLLLSLRESGSSLIGQLYWLGFRRRTVPYRRLPRRYGVSAWSLRKKLGYVADSVFAFTDLPIRVLGGIGLLGLGLALVLSAAVLAARLLGHIPVSGYAATMLTVLFFGSLHTLGIGVIGEYAWRAYENTKGRPAAVVSSETTFAGAPPRP